MTILTAKASFPTTIIALVFNYIKLYLTSNKQINNKVIKADYPIDKSCGRSYTCKQEMRTKRADANPAIAALYAEHQKHAADIRALPACEAKAFLNPVRDCPVAAASI